MLSHICTLVSLMVGIVTTRCGEYISFKVSKGRKFTHFFFIFNLPEYKVPGCVCDASPSGVRLSSICLSGVHCQFTPLFVTFSEISGPKKPHNKGLRRLSRPLIESCNCTARQCSPLRRKFMECYIIKPAQTLSVKHLVIGQR